MKTEQTIKEFEKKLMTELEKAYELGTECAIFCEEHRKYD